ncbi:MAG: LptF/LptG family permease [bacterium]
MKILTCYVAKGIVKPFFLSFILIQGLLLIGQTASSMDRFLEGQASLFLIAKFLLLQVPENTLITTPISILLAVLSFSGRMSANNELTAMGSSGISPMPIIAVVSAISLFLSLSLLYLNQTLLPKAQLEYKKAKQLMCGGQPTEEDNKLTLKLKERFVSIGKLNGNSVSSIRIQTSEKELYAEEGKYHQGKKQNTRAPEHQGTREEDGYQNKWLLSNGVERKIEKGEVVAEERFAKKAVFLPSPEALALMLKSEKTEEMSLTELFRLMRLTESYGLAGRKARQEFHFRTSFSLSPFILALLGLAIIIRGFKVGLYASFGLALLLSFFYWEMNLFLRSLSLICSPILSGWGANLMGLAVAVKLIWR